MSKERAQYFTAAEQELLTEGYREFQSLIKTQGNTAKAAKARREGWQKVADKINSATRGPTRTWEQVKVKYKNILQNATKKRAEQQKTGGGPAPPRHTPAEELALGLNATRPSVEGTSGSSSSLDQQPGCSSSSTFLTVVDDTPSLLPVPMQGVTEACTDSEPTLSDDCGLEEVPGDICALCKRSLQKKTEYTELKKQKLLGDIKLQTLKRKKLQLEIKLLQKELQIKKQTHRTRMDPARLFPVSLQHPNPHQHLQQQYWQHLQHPGKEQPVVRSKPGHLPPILYPQIVLLHQTHCADQVYISSPEEVTTASQWTEVHAGSGGQGSMSCAKEDQKSKPHKGNPGHEADPGNEADLGSDADQGNEANTGNESKTPKENIPASLTEDCDSPGPTASLDEEAVNKHSVEECFSLLESFFDQLFLAQTKDTREEEHGEVGYPKLKIRSFLEYLDELCRDEEFVSKVESTAKMEALMSLLSAIQDLFEEQEQDLALVMIIARARSCYSKMLPQMILQEELPPCPPNSDHFYGETPLVSSQSLFLDAPGSLFASSPNRNGQNSSQNEVGISWSPLLLSNLLEEPPSPNHNPLDASDAFSQDDFFASILDRKAQTTAPL